MARHTEGRTETVSAAIWPGLKKLFCSEAIWCCTLSEATNNTFSVMRMSMVAVRCCHLLQSYTNIFFQCHLVVSSIGLAETKKVHDVIIAHAQFFAFQMGSGAHGIITGKQTPRS